MPVCSVGGGSRSCVCALSLPASPGSLHALAPLPLPAGFHFGCSLKLFVRCLFLCPRHVADGILAPQQGIEPSPSAVEGQGPNHWPHLKLSDSDVSGTWVALPPCPERLSLLCVLALSLGVQSSQLSYPFLGCSWQLPVKSCPFSRSSSPNPLFLPPFAVSVQQSFPGQCGQGRPFSFGSFLHSGRGKGSGWDFLPLRLGCCSPPQSCTTSNACEGSCRSFQ